VRGARAKPVKPVKEVEKAETGPRLLLLDGHSLAYRAFFALPVENF
jgi:DNA polymerase-1